MAEFIKDYGEVIELIAICIGAIATGVIAFMTWLALRAWKKQKKVATAEKYIDLLWQLWKFGTADLKEALLNDIMDDSHIKPVNVKEGTFFLSTIDNLISLQSPLLLISKIFPKTAKNMFQLNKDIILIMDKAEELEKQIIGELQKQLTDELRVSEAEFEAKKRQALIQVADFFTADNELIKRIEDTHREMHAYLENYIVKGLR